MGKTKEHPTAKYINLRIVHVSAIIDTQKVYIIWKNGEEAVVDFSEIIAKNKWFRPLQDPIEFQTVKHVDWGAGIEWRCGADSGSDSVRWMADQQKTVIHKKKRKIA